METSGGVPPTQLQGHQFPSYLRFNSSLRKEPLSFLLGRSVFKKLHMKTKTDSPNIIVVVQKHVLKQVVRMETVIPQS